MASASTCDGFRSDGSSGSTSGSSVQPAITHEAPPRESSSDCCSRSSAALRAPSGVAGSPWPALMPRSP
eukprot:2410017-Prymnesium_polylepis.1